MSSYDLDTYFPMQGICYHCGRDLRHHKLEEIAQRFSTGESVDSLANDLKVPPQAVELALSRNYATPLGRTMKPMVRSRAA